jgi:hypothetical protein
LRRRAAPQRQRRGQLSAVLVAQRRKPAINAAAAAGTYVSPCRRLLLEGHVFAAGLLVEPRGARRQLGAAQGAGIGDSEGPQPCHARAVEDVAARQQAPQASWRGRRRQRVQANGALVVVLVVAAAIADAAAREARLNELDARGCWRQQRRSAAAHVPAIVLSFVFRGPGARRRRRELAELLGKAKATVPALLPMGPLAVRATNGKRQCVRKQPACFCHVCFVRYIHFELTRPGSSCCSRPRGRTERTRATCSAPRSPCNWHIP